MKFAPEKALLAATYYYLFNGDLRKAKKLYNNVNKNNLTNILKG